MAERKGAAYRIKSTRPASSHAEHTQTTQATQWTNQYGELTAGLSGLKNWRPGSTSEAAYQESRRRPTFRTRTASPAADLLRFQRETTAPMPRRA